MQGFFDNITSYFTDSSTPDQGSPAENSVSYPDPNTPLSNQFKLKDLTQTSQQLSNPNLPTDPQHISNLMVTAQGIEFLESKLGPVRIISAYRTKELQNKLAAQGEPVSSGLSFHEVGRGIDFVPASGSIDEYFGKILADEELKSMFSEIAWKPSQGSIHAAFNIPGDERQTRILALDSSSNSYGLLSADQIADFIKPYIDSSIDAVDYAAANLVTYNRTPLILGMVAAFGGVIYFALRAKPKTARNPRLKAKFIREFQNISNTQLLKILRKSKSKIDRMIAEGSIENDKNEKIRSFTKRLLKEAQKRNLIKKLKFEDYE